MVDKVPKAKKRKDPEPIVEARRQNRRRRSDAENQRIQSFLNSAREREDRL